MWSKVFLCVWMLMEGSGTSSSRLQSLRKESLMGKNNSSSQSLSLPKTKKKMSKKVSPISKQQAYSENLQQDGKQDHSTDSDRERPSIFTEIWPSSEPSSPSDTSDKNVQKSSRIKSSEIDAPHNSVLARYMDRFRHGQPQSREERQQKSSNDKEEQLPFWWASSSSLPPHLIREDTELNLAHNPCRGSINMLDTSQCESEIWQLQERASRLLQKGEFCLEEDSLPVSSDGVGCSDFSSPVSTDEHVRRPMISSLLQCNIAKDPPPVVPPLVAPVRPEEDILFQWRLRRKMEQAREWTQAQQSLNPHNLPSTLQTIHTPNLPQGTKHQLIREPNLATSDQQTQATTAPTRTTTMDASGSLVSPPQTLAHVPRHMHLLCDILPCSNQHSHPCEESVSQRLDSHVAILPQKALNSITKSMSSQKTPITGSAEKDANVSRSKNIEGPKKQPERSEKNASVLSKQLKKSAGVHSRHKISQQQMQKYAEANKKTRAEGAPSPIHSTLGQVVSEVLFPSMDSSTVQELSPAVPSSPVSAPQCNSHKSGEVISQLLQEAEDSDEKEFEDDPLLQVLRKQRKWVKEQINEVDILLTEFSEQHSI